MSVNCDPFIVDDVAHTIYARAWVERGRGYQRVTTKPVAVMDLLVAMAQDPITFACMDAVVAIKRAADVKTAAAKILEKAS